MGHPPIDKALSDVHFRLVFGSYLAGLETATATATRRHKRSNIPTGELRDFVADEEDAPHRLGSVEVFADDLKDVEESLRILDFREERRIGFEAPVRQGQKAVPRDGNDLALVPPPVERHHEVDRCLAGTDQDYVIAAREASEHALGPSRTYRLL
jgi:hypothetical protein